jgi:alkylglycerol monooxygenase
MPNYIALAIPFFFILIAGELIWARARGVRVYRLDDAITDLSCGVTSQITNIFYAAILLGIYAFIYDHYRVVTWSSPWAIWLIAFFGVDFLYYWWHRASHEVNVLWAAHIVHHSSEDYNLAVALRQAVLTSWTSLIFYAPLALVGVPPLVYATTVAFSTLYQFWIHTQLVGKVRGPLDYILNLPSHHRVHHAINPRYLDKNYGATLIIWDRLFGTYEEEIEAPVYGITKPLGSFNPWWAQVHYWIELARMSWRAPHFADKLHVWWKSPAWHPRGMPAPPPKEVTPETWPKYRSTLSPRLGWYLFANYVLMIVGATALIYYGAKIPMGFLAASAGAVLLALLSFGALMERKRWAGAVEVLRLAGTGALACAWLL